jgi:tetratricopeptide (TPR) repeat protein
MHAIQWRWLALAAVVFGLHTEPVRADESTDEQLFQKVMKRLLKSDLFVRDYPDKFAFPPKAFIKPKSAKEMNAYASAAKVHGAEFDEKTKKIRPVVMITQGFMDKVIQGDENSLAVIMGHELAHLTKDHVTGDRKGDTGVLFLAFGRDDEIEADLNGLRYAIASGYPYKKGVAKAFREMRTKTNYSSFEGLSTTHPTWEERLIFLDREQAKLWSAMTAFQNGFVFLEMEQYLSAQQCFKAVVAEFPDCHEGWANLGYARLMQYCDGLDYDDLKRYDIGQIVTGGFYSRPDSLESKVRGIDEKLWKDAVSALNKSLAGNVDLVLPRASLGVAYLVHPEGRDVKKAKKFFAEALAHLEKDPALKKNTQGLAALLINSGVADLAGGDAKEAERKFTAADDLTLRLPPTGVARSMDGAIVFNQAMLLARSSVPEEKHKACTMLESYLVRNAPTSAWWPLAYSRYAKLGKDLDAKVRTRVSFLQKAKPQDLRIVTSVSVGKETITLSDPALDAVKRLGEDASDPIPLFPGSKIVRWRFPDRGIDLLAKDKILAIFLTNAKAPPVTLRQIGVAGDSETLKVGMSESAAKHVLKDQRSDRNLRTIADAKISYHFYPEIGLAIRYANARVEEIAIAQIPRRRVEQD